MSRLKRLLPYITILLILSGVLAAWWQRWSIYDWWQLRGYSAPAEISQLATDTTMNPQATRLFYVYHPELNDRDSFREKCSSAERTIVLGCYVPAQGIYLHKIEDSRLNGVLQVTAAHEMLHAAYDRLDSDERDRVDKLLESAFNQMNNKRINQTIADYQESGADINNELHSILATEVRELPPQLEEYYKQYFVNRKKIVDYSEQYEAAFTKQKEEVAKYDNQLKKLKLQIDQLQASLGTQANELEQKRNHLQALLAAKNYDAYNAGVPVYNSDVNAYNDDVLVLRSLISQYNALVEKRNKAALEENELVKAIDSRIETIKQQ